MPITELYHTLMKGMMELRPAERITRVRNFAWLMAGIYASRSVHLSKIAGKIPGQAKRLSTTRRMRRLLDNSALQVRSWYEELARSWLQSQYAALKEVRLIVDGTKVGFAHQLLIVSLAYRRRAIPIAWTWVKQVRGHSKAGHQLALLHYVKGLLPPASTVFLVGDSEFGAIQVLAQLDQWRWHYVVRQKSNTWVWREATQEAKRFGDWLEREQQSIWLGRGYLTRSAPYGTSLIVPWKKGEPDPWCLATNLSDKGTALALYKRRMWIEEMFGDFKGHGFDLEASMLHTFSRLSRLTLAVVVLYLWAVSIGVQTIKYGLRHLVDRKDRRDLSIFQIGLRFIERRLINAKELPVSMCRYL